MKNITIIQKSEIVKSPYLSDFFVAWSMSNRNVENAIEEGV